MENSLNSSAIMNEFHRGESVWIQKSIVFDDIFFAALPLLDSLVIEWLHVLQFHTGKYIVDYRFICTHVFLQCKLHKFREKKTLALIYLNQIQKRRKKNDKLSKQFSWRGMLYATGSTWIIFASHRRHHHDMLTHVNLFTVESK